MWLTLTTVTLIGPAKKQTSLVRKTRVNMNAMEMYFDAPDEMKNHKSENARANTLLFARGAVGTAIHVKETCEQIDEMFNPQLMNEPEEPITPEPSPSGWSNFK